MTLLDLAYTPCCKDLTYPYTPRVRDLIYEDLVLDATYILSELHRNYGVVVPDGFCEGLPIIEDDVEIGVVLKLPFALTLTILLKNGWEMDPVDSIWFSKGTARIKLDFRANGFVAITASRKEDSE